jgi:hypothetical protein
VELDDDFCFCSYEVRNPVDIQQDPEYDGEGSDNGRGPVNNGDNSPDTFCYAYDLRVPGDACTLDEDCTTDICTNSICQDVPIVGGFTRIEGYCTAQSNLGYYAVGIFDRDPLLGISSEQDCVDKCQTIDTTSLRTMEMDGDNCYCGYNSVIERPAASNFSSTQDFTGFGPVNPFGDGSNVNEEVCYIFST